MGKRWWNELIQSSTALKHCNIGFSHRSSFDEIFSNKDFNLYIQMNITYVSSFDAKSILSYSGTGYYIPAKLKQAGDQVEYIGNLRKINPIYQKVKCRLYKYAGKNYLIERNPDVLQLWARKIEKELNSSAEVLLSYSSQPYSQLQLKTPKVFCIFITVGCRCRGPALWSSPRKSKSS
ncbi:MAG: hypothetical protein ACOC31_03785 [Bacteroidota bacterium]